MITPPQNLRAEESVLGAMLLSPRAVETVVGILDASDFYRASHGTVYRACVALWEKGEPVDAITLANELEERGELEGLGGSGRVAELAALVPAAANVGHYARIVKANAIERDEMDTGARLARREIDAAEAIERLGAIHRPPSGSRLECGPEFILDAPTDVPAVWGDGDRVLWSEGEPLLLVGPDGVGKTTLAQQVVAARLGIRDDVLGLPVRTSGLPVLYIAADRPVQAARSMRRMVAERHREALGLLRIWRGPLDVDLTQRPRSLVDLAIQARAGTVVVDSLKDVVVNLASDEAGSAAASAFQHVVAAGIDLLVLHHQRKGDGGPKSIEDVYGSRWITAACGSVILLWGTPGATTVKLRQLKQPASPVGPLSLEHDHRTGTTTVAEDHDAERSGSFLVDRVIAEVARQPGITQKRLFDAIEGRDAEIRAAITEAVDCGLIRMESGARSALHHYLADKLRPTPGTRSDEVGRRASVTSSPDLGPAPSLDAPDEVGTAPSNDLGPSSGAAS